LLTGPAGLIILLGGALFAARKLFDQNQEEYLKLAKEKKEKGSLSEKDEARLKELSTPVNREKARQDLKYDPTTGKAVSDEEAKKSKDQVNRDTQASYKRIEDDAFIQLANEWEKGGKKDPLLDPNDSRNVTRRTKELIAQGYVPKPIPVDVKVEGSGAPSILPNENETAGGAAVGLYPTPGMQRKPGLNHGGRTTQKLVGGGVDDERLIKSNTPTPAPYSNEGRTKSTASPISVNIPGSSKETSKTPTVEKFDYTKYKELVGIREGGGKYDADNKVGFLGKYQFGAQALETFGYLKPGTSVDRNAVYSPSNWTGKNSISSADDFKKASDTQENLMNAYTDMNLKGLQKSGVLTGEDSGSSIAAKLYAAHHGGVGGASKFFKENKDTADFAFSGASVGKSAALMATAYETGKIGGAEYSGLGGASGTVVASASNRMQPDVKDSAGKINQATTQVAEAKDSKSESSIVNNVTNNNVNNSTSGGGSSASTASVYDDLFAKLVERALA
jgi:hypothetical protein